MIAIHKRELEGLTRFLVEERQRQWALHDENMKEKKKALEERAAERKRLLEEKRRQREAELEEERRRKSEQSEKERAVEEEKELRLVEINKALHLFERPYYSKTIEDVTVPKLTQAELGLQNADSDFRNKRSLQLGLEKRAGAMVSSDLLEKVRRIEEIVTDLHRNKYAEIVEVVAAMQESIERSF